LRPKHHYSENQKKANDRIAIHAVYSFVKTNTDKDRVASAKVPNPTGTTESKKQLEDGGGESLDQGLCNGITRGQDHLIERDKGTSNLNINRSHKPTNRVQKERCSSILITVITGLSPAPISGVPVQAYTNSVQNTF